VILIDTHTHLYLEEFNADRDEALKRAKAHSVQRFYLPNIDSSSIEALHSLCDANPDTCIPMMGLHPCSVKEDVQAELSNIKTKLYSERKYAAVGEIGMDLYWDKSFVLQQEMAFRTQIRWALEKKLPIVIHCRDAFDEIFSVLKTETELPPGIFHCFSGNLEQAEKIISFHKFKLGIGGVLTFKNSGLDKVIEQISMEHIVLETDSPYLAPVPHRGKRNESSYLLAIAARLAEIKKIPIQEVAEITTQNAFQIFPF
jgi:TatD DNase family protein